MCLAAGAYPVAHSEVLIITVAATFLYMHLLKKKEGKLGVAFVWKKSNPLGCAFEPYITHAFNQ